MVMCIWRQMGNQVFKLAEGVIDVSADIMLVERHMKQIQQTVSWMDIM